METHDAFKKIIELMCCSGVSVADIEKALQPLPTGLLFDLAVKENGGIKRVHFAKFLNVPREQIVGIYLSKNDERFLELEEKHHSDYGIYPWTTTRDIDVEGIPDEHTFKRINMVLEPLNVALKNIAANPFDDLYVIRSFSGGYSAVLTFNWREDMYPLDWYGPKVRRYMCPENYLRPYQDDRIEVGTYLIEKEDALAEIIELITGYGISLSDIRNGLSLVPAKAQFDLAIIEADGNITRVPFAEYQTIARQCIVGIYPFKDDVGFLELHEKADADSCSCEYRVDAIKLEVMRRLDKIAAEFNKALKALRYRPFNGRYLAQRTIHGTTGFLVPSYTADCGDEELPVKLRRYIYPDKKKYVFRDRYLEII